MKKSLILSALFFFSLTIVFSQENERIVQNNQAMRNINSKLIIFPNPSADMVTVNTGTEHSTLVQLFNVEGKFIESWVVENTLSMDLSHLEKGNYLFIAIDGNTKETSLFIKL
jgi:hypothetical protein